MADGPTPTERFIRGIIPENPVYRAVLGMCPVLAVTAGVAQALTMGGAVMFVLFCANVITSLLRGILKPHLRILVFTLTIATFVTIVDRFLGAFMFNMSRALGPYIPLIIVNCIIICRCEVCASKQGVLPAIGDALGQSIGFTLALLSMAVFREFLGSGKLLGYSILPPNATLDPSVWQHWGVMILPPGAFLTLGLLMGLFNHISNRAEDRKKALADAHDLENEPQPALA
jgi:electron transport complex protein RnfE